MKWLDCKLVLIITNSQKFNIADKNGIFMLSVTFIYPYNTEREART